MGFYGKDIILDEQNGSKVAHVVFFSFRGAFTYTHLDLAFGSLRYTRIILVIRIAHRDILASIQSRFKTQLSRFRKVGLQGWPC